MKEIFNRISIVGMIIRMAINILAGESQSEPAFKMGVAQSINEAMHSSRWRALPSPADQRIRFDATLILCPEGINPLPLENGVFTVSFDVHPPVNVASEAEGCGS